MRQTAASVRNEGFTKWDLLIIIAVLGVLAALLLSALAKARAKAQRISCIGRLKQIGLAFRVWSYEHGEKFPWAVSITNARPGTLEFAESSQTWRHFQIISNELTLPKLLACPSDTRQRVASWQEFTSNKHLSYFAGLDADETTPQTILSGDRNLNGAVQPTNGILRLTATTPVEWTKEIHKSHGNVGLADASVQQLSTRLLNKQIESALSSSTNSPVLRLALPE